MRLPNPSGITQTWRMSISKRSPRYTTTWGERSWLIISSFSFSN
ncbi:MAG: hypothetical protein EAZ60_23355 [Oscillatoriales cyanobacterium]|nr:MAG: hypothetical protein EAZ83_02950 [Oscillatoriales cyanobacterium]TAF00283.1 MAG: hypothetical protein EAZ79_03045 [Oscillatoriales cyanobacterium]TAF19370.1 MAG: hypothetical protein EAZ73_15380 [Oscillatoriales cyanobacterium]TAF37084.1 MAG: hypothetical protein EAZ69_08505 [Oscillatoriales cyanobacterium]TAF52520.1 MAG: hypothetical protein EAZ60_23355 [Oscillatoriales cyanobacterium]